jgi:Mn-dependent DtxR family transcriptional regulator
MAKETKNFRVMEQIVRGFSNHRRIQIMELLDKNPELSVVEISERLKINFKTAAEHIQRLANSGLVFKRSAGKAVRHKLTDRGNVILTFLRTLE